MRRTAEFRLGRHRIVTVHARLTEIPVLNRQLDGSTVKRRILRKIALPVLIAQTLLRPNGSLRARQALHQLSQPLKEAANNIGTDVGSYIVMWPKGERSRRRYVICLNERGHTSYFVKISTDPELDRQLFQNEISLLNHLQHHPLEKWQAPCVLFFVESDNSIALVLDALPTNRRNMTWAEIDSRLPLTTVHDNQRSSASEQPPALHPTWLDRVLQDPLISTTFQDLIAERRGLMTSSTLVNADIRPANAVIACGDNWLIDWEFGTQYGPANCDSVTFIINRLQAQSSTRKIRVIQRRLLSQTDNLAIPRHAVALSLAYLTSVGHPLATSLTHSTWDDAMESSTQKQSGIETDKR